MNLMHIMNDKKIRQTFGKTWLLLSTPTQLQAAATAAIDKSKLVATAPTYLHS